MISTVKAVEKVQLVFLYGFFISDNHTRPLYVELLNITRFLIKNDCAIFADTKVRAILNKVVI